MKVFGLVGWSGSGKTTLMVRLLPELIARGLTVSTMKHTHHKVDLDTPGKDTYRHREAGAKEVMMVSSSRWALMHELGDEPEPPVEAAIARMTPVDLLLIEGFKHHPHDKLEVHRPALGRPPLAREDASVRAVASDVPAGELDLAERGIPVLDLDDVKAIADFVVHHCRLAPSAEEHP